MNISTKPKNSPLLVSAAVIIQEGKVLITLRPEHKPQGGLWEFPGGKIDPDESPANALQRELKEELDLDICVEEVIDVLYYRYSWGPVLILAYLCSITSGTPRNLEVAEHKWAPLQELQHFDMLPADKPLIAKLQKFI
jgi:8-oxo-dGTP diphosphatase